MPASRLVLLTVSYLHSDRSLDRMSRSSGSLHKPPGKGMSSVESVAHVNGVMNPPKRFGLKLPIADIRERERCYLKRRQRNELKLNKG